MVREENAVRRWFVAAAACLVSGVLSQSFAQTPASLPAGFSMKAGNASTTYESTLDGERIISIRSKGSGAIARYPVDIPVEPGLRIDWNWKLNSLPSAVAETAKETHDYSSVAIEFEDGRDLSWYWSAALAPEEHFVCPLPNWETETHLVVRSGEKDIGKWMAESRDVAADVVKALPNPPKRIVAVWLINYSVPQKLGVSTDIKSINFVRPDGSKQVVFPN